MWATIAAALLLCQQVPAQRDSLAYVRSESELEEAVTKGVPHIEIQEHLDLRSQRFFRPSNEDVERFNSPPLFNPSTTLESLRGNCSGPVPFDVPLGRELKPRQCVMALRDHLMRLSPAANQSMWIDNIYIYNDNENFTALLNLGTDHKNVWMTNNVFEGTRQNSTGIVLSGEQSNYYIGDSAVLNNRQLNPGVFVYGGLEGKRVSARLRRVAFEGNEGFDVQSSTVFVFQLAFAAVEACAFSDNAGLQDIKVWNATAGADDPDAYDSTTGFEGMFGPLTVITSNITFLAEDDAELQDIQQRSLEGRTPLAELADAPAPGVADLSRQNRSGTQETAGVLGSGDSGKTNAGAIGGGVAGAVVLLMAAGLLARWFIRKLHSGGAATAWGNDSTKLSGSAGATPPPSSLPAMHVGSFHHTFSSGLSSTNGYHYNPGAGSQMYKAGGQSQMDTPGFGGWGPPQPPCAGPHAQQCSAWLSAPPPRGGQPATIYWLPSTAGSGDVGGAVANMLATQRPAPTLVDIMAAETQREQLERALHSVAARQPQELFMGRFLFMQERRGGGQATVQFARSGDGGFFQYAVKFFNRVQDFAIEEGMYRQQAIKATLPDLFASAANSDGAVRARSGYVFPPFLVMERGMTLADWLQAPRDALAVLGMFKDCAALLATLHAAGHVHRDIKPDNVLLMLQTQAWRLIDFGIAAPAGKEVAPQCTLGYAAPEVVVAFDKKRAIDAAPAQDVWALGVMVFEAFTRKPAIDPFGGVDGCKAVARGETQYPWEEQEQDKAFGGSRARRLVESCLARDPAARPTAAALIEAITLISNHTESIE